MAAMVLTISVAACKHAPVGLGDPYLDDIAAFRDARFVLLQADSRGVVYFKACDCAGTYIRDVGR